MLSLFTMSGLAQANVQVINVGRAATIFVVKLAANSTTGYQWSVVSFDKNLLSLDASDYQKSASNLIGSGGEMVYTFSLKKGKVYPSKTDLVFKYARSWEVKGFRLQKVRVLFNK